MIDLCLDVVFTHGPQLFVKLGRYLMGAQVLNSLRGHKKKKRVKKDCFYISEGHEYSELPLRGQQVSSDTW